MTVPRLQQLLEFEKEDPNDPFILYALASEYQKMEPEKALKYYLRLVTEHETYTGTYYQLGKFYEQLGRPAEAKDIYKKGIIVCRDAGKHKAASELMGALNQIQEEEEDY